MSQFASQNIIVPNKTLRLVQILESELNQGKFVEGQRFLSTHEIARSYKVSPGTARKALVELVGRGCLSSAKRSGHYLRRQTAKREPSQVQLRQQTATVLLTVINSTLRGGRHRLEEYMLALTKACDRLEWSVLQVNNDALEIERAIKGQRLAGCLAYGLNEPPAGKIDPASIIYWSGNYNDAASSIMGIDHQSTSRLAYEHLWDFGHQRTAMVRPTAWDSLEEARKREGSVLGMRRAYADLGYPWNLQDVIQVAPNEIDGLYQRLCDAGITGVFCEDWSITAHLYQQAYRAGQVIGDRLSLVTAGGNDLEDKVHPRPARVYWRAVEYAAVVIRAIRNLIDGTPLPPRLVIPVFLEPGPSVRPPRRA